MEVMDYYGLVVTLARRAHERLSAAGAAIDFEDLLQEASLGLLAAARRYDPDRGVEFSTFAYPRPKFQIGLRSNSCVSLKLRRLGVCAL